MMRARILCAIGGLALLSPAVAGAEMPHHGAATDTTRRGSMRGAMPGMAMEHRPGLHAHMTGMLGPYTAAREASGTSWQPEAAGHHGIEAMPGPWMVMVHGFADVVFDDQGGPRGAREAISTNMGRVMAQRRLGPGTLGLRSMLSLEPATVGKRGYPLLLQTGETADGRTPLIDRQHPHDLFMELAGSYAVASGSRSLFLYAGLPGEPALGPPTYMHRFAGADIPLVPITHHWLDSTHITYGVLTLGAVADRLKVEASAFRGREPDQKRWNLETPRLDSYSFRVSANPTPHWALQASHGRLHRPEQLTPDVDQDRTTVSASYVGAAGPDGTWGGTLAWGRDRDRPGHVLDGYEAELAVERGRHTAFARAERVRKDGLFAPPDPRQGVAYGVAQVTAGYRYDPWRGEHATIGLGLSGSMSYVPPRLRGSYGGTPAGGLVFVHVAAH